MRQFNAVVDDDKTEGKKEENGADDFDPAPGTAPQLFTHDIDSDVRIVHITQAQAKHEKNRV